MGGGGDVFGAQSRSDAHAIAVYYVTISNQIGFICESISIVFNLVGL